MMRKQNGSDTSEDVTSGCKIGRSSLYKQLQFSLHTHKQPDCSDHDWFMWFQAGGAKKKQKKPQNTEQIKYKSCYASFRPADYFPSQLRAPAPQKHIFQTHNSIFKFGSWNLWLADQQIMQNPFPRLFEIIETEDNAYYVVPVGYINPTDSDRKLLSVII